MCKHESANTTILLQKKNMDMLEGNKVLVREENYLQTPRLFIMSPRLQLLPDKRTKVRKLYRSSHTQAVGHGCFLLICTLLLRVSSSQEG
jgi:hypothetical protein